jgi:SnoaL-like domain
MGMDRARVMAWVSGYEKAWREDDVDAVDGLFTPAARYRRSPYEPPDLGQAGIRTLWREDAGGPGFTMSAEVVAVEAWTAVVRVLVNYLPPDAQEYTDLWVLKFAEDGRVEDFEEWAYWPGSSYTAKS